ncbi:two-component regulator propeller domain-containing protein [Marinilabilia sp.]|uniref:hybrid sensor histidine kinase/response regulator transcription factor n=1 Tax=Marinilabilia sp. TaxID=2021252 RepID=UPI0025B8286B|nr:two-component regulator propeller domain-containing protein [Marinilabilia sp.]
MVLLKKIGTLVFFLIGFPFLFLVKGEFSYHIQYLTIDQGLPQNTVNDILRDQDGFMWFATGNGLSRYDGYDFSNFWKPDLPSNLVNAPTQSHANYIWIGTSQGLARYNQNTEEFEEFLLSDALDGSFNIVALYTDSDDRIWVGTYEQGLFLITHEEDDFAVAHFDTTNSLLPGNHVASFLQMEDGRILIGTNHGIAVSDHERSGIHLFSQPGLNNALILSIFESREGDLWIGTINGLWVYNPVTGRDEWFFHDPLESSSLSHNRVNSIIQDFRGNIYIGSLGGVDVYKVNSNSFESFPFNTIDEFSLNSIFINAVDIDKEGNVWVGTEKGGVNHFNLYQKPFNYIIHEPNNPNSLSNNTINSIYGEDEILWIGTAGGGLNRYNRRNGQFRRFRHEPGNPFSIPSDYVTAITKTAGETLWVGTWGSGLAKMMPDGTFRTMIPPVSNRETNFQNAFISSLLYDARGYLFVGTEGGIAILDLDTETFVDINQNNNALVHISEIGCLMKDSKNYLWIGTRTGLFRLPVQELDLPYNAVCPSSQLQVFRSDSSNGLPGNYITSLGEDMDGNIWIGTYGDGLVEARLDSVGEYSFQKYNKTDGLSNNVIYAIQEDVAGFIWVSTDYGLSRINSETGQIDNFFADDGLLSDQFYWSASFKSESGELFFGSINGVNHFFPSSFPMYPHEPEVTISSLKVFNSEIEVGDKRYGKVVLGKPVQDVKEISLSYKDNVFSLEFTALDYFLTRKIKYAYQLEGVDRDWVEVASSQRSASYTNLKGGTYLFKVKASNSDGRWSDEVTTILITIRPPFWQTTWFLVLLILALIAGTFLYIKHHTRRLLLEKEKLERTVLERTERIAEQNDKMRQQAEELRETNTDLKRKSGEVEGQKLELEEKNKEIMLQRDKLLQLNEEIESINQSRLRFFTNISHEFRTPLTLIISPVERLLKEMHLPGVAHELLTSVQRNARRLNLLIDQLLMFRKIETGNLSVRITNSDLPSFISEVFHAYDILAKQKNIIYIKNVNLENRPYWFDDEKLENILYNLLSNAFKYTPEGGEITLTVTEQHPEHQKPSLSIEVTDTGIGIKEEQMEKIFKRFYRTAGDTYTKGTGIGLALTKELVDAMNGSIVVSRNANQGSRFIVTLPYRQEDFSGAEVNELPTYDSSEITNKVQVVLDNIQEEEVFLAANSVESSDEATVLIVEDNKELALFIANSLSGQYHVQVAENGKVGYEIARKNPPELIISDVMMPEMDGIEMCRQIKNNLYTSHVPVIMLSAKALMEDQLQGLQFGADDYISKPFNLDILKAKVHNAIETRRKIRSLFTSQSEIPEVSTKSESLDDKFLAKAYDVLEKSYSNPDFSVEMFSDSMFVSRSLLYKKLKALVDLSPNDFITIYRLKKARPLILSKEMTVSEVAYSVGFNDPKYFSRVFKKFFKKTPSEYLE